MLIVTLLVAELSIKMIFFFNPKELAILNSSAKGILTCKKNSVFHFLRDQIQNVHDGQTFMRRRTALPSIEDSCSLQQIRSWRKHNHP